MQEAAYTKSERGETAITISFLQKVAEVLEIDPLYVMALSPNNILENISNACIANMHSNTFQTSNEQYTHLMIKMMENVITLKERMVSLMETISHKQ